MLQSNARVVAPRTWNASSPQIQLAAKFIRRWRHVFFLTPARTTV